MGNVDKRIEQLRHDLDKLRCKVLKAKKSKKFTKLNNWKQFRANVNKEDNKNE